MSLVSIVGQDAAPYLLLLLAAILPTGMWRLAGVVAGRSLDGNSPLLDWVRLVSVSLLAAVVAKLLVSPGGALVAVPALARYAAVAAALAGFAAFRRSLLAGVVTGEVVIILAAWWTHAA